MSRTPGHQSSVAVLSNFIMSKSSLRHPVALSAGLVLVGLTICLSNTSLERLFGRNPGELVWGPGLFRVLLLFHGLLLIGIGFVAVASSMPESRTRTNRGGYILLTVITIFCLLLRLPALNSCLWLDEVLTMVNFAQWPLSHIFTSFPDQNQHMLFSMLAHCSIRIFGEHAWALRFPSVLFGVGSVWALFLLGRRLIGESESLLACALLAVSYHHIWFSQNARGYSGLLFFTILATWLWLKAVDTDRLSIWAGYAVCMALGFWIHITMIFVLAGHGLLFFLLDFQGKWKGKRLPKGTVAFIVASTLTLQIYALSLPEFLRTALSETSLGSDWTNPLWVISEVAHSFQLGMAATALTALLIVGLIGFAGLQDIFRKNKLAALAMCLTPFIGGFSMIIIGHNLWPRFFFFCMGFAILVLVHGVFCFFNLLRGVGIRFQHQQRIAYVMIALLILGSIATIPRCYALPKQDYTGARDFVEQQRSPGDEVIVVGLAEHVYARYYAPAWRVVHTPEELALGRRRGQHVFLVYTLAIELKASRPEIWKVINTDFEVLKIFPGTLGGGEVYVCKERGHYGSGSVNSLQPTHLELRP